MKSINGTLEHEIFFFHEGFEIKRLKVIEIFPRNSITVFKDILIKNIKITYQHLSSTFVWEPKNFQIF